MKCWEMSWQDLFLGEIDSPYWPIFFHLLSSSTLAKNCFLQMVERTSLNSFSWEEQRRYLLYLLLSPAAEWSGKHSILFCCRGWSEEQRISSDHGQWRVRASQRLQSSEQRR